MGTGVERPAPHGRPAPKSAVRGAPRASGEAATGALRGISPFPRGASTKNAGGRAELTPRPERALESITLDLVEELAGSLGIDRVRRPIDRSELYIADELGIVGTLSEVTLVRSIDDIELPSEAPILSALEERYRNAVLAIEPHAAVEMSIVESAPPATATLR